MDEVIGKLSPEQYWQWRFHAEHMEKGNIQAKLAGSHLALHDKDGEIYKLKTTLVKNHVSSVQDQANAARNEYQIYRAKLEEQLGFKLENCVIDEVTFEVKKLEEDSNNGSSKTP